MIYNEVMPIGNCDWIARSYFSDSDVFADAFNFHFFHGEQVVLPSSLEEVEPHLVDAHSVLPGNKVVCGERDVVKRVVSKSDERHILRLLGIESQSYVDYAMPLRVMGYDYLQYKNQYAAIAREHHEKKDCRGEEFLSGFTKCDRLLPVTTLVVYLGPTPWTGALDLWGMMDGVKCGDLPFVQNYGINVLQPYAIEDADMSKFRSDMGLLMPLFKTGNNLEALKKLVTTDSRYKSMRPLTAALFRAAGGVALDINQEKDKEKINMFKALEELFQEGRQEGRQEGMQEGRQECIENYIRVERGEMVSDDGILRKLVKIFNLSPEEARSYLI